MATLPPQYADSPWYDQMMAEGLTRTSVGKVREGYIDPVDPDRRLFLATDRISIFNFVLPALVPRKGEVLTALSHFWMTNLLIDYPNDMIMSKHFGDNKAIWRACHECHPDFPWERITLAHLHKVEPYEIIFRRHLGGSVWKEYEQTQIVAGIKLRARLKKWECLPEALFTPTEKSEEDDPLTVERFYEVTGVHGENAVKKMSAAYDLVYNYAVDRGIRILDTKLEYGYDDFGGCVFLDEKFTPDSSRFVDEGNWIVSMENGREPAFRDKQIVREWGMTIKTPFVGVDGKPIVGINKLKGSNPEHIAFVHALQVPNDLLDRTSWIYLDLFEDLVGCDLDVYQRDEMRIAG